MPEERFVEALAFAHQAIQPIIKAIKDLVAVAGKPKAKFELVGATPEARAIIERVAGPKISDAIFGKEKAVRSANIKALKEEAKAALVAELGEGKFADADLNVVFEDLQYKAYRKTVLERGVRADGRDAKTLRPISCEVGVLPRVHGSALFERGDTQGLVITTLGPTKEAQDMDGLTGGATSKSLHPPLQLPAVLRRRDRPLHRPRPPRDRPRRPRRALARARPARPRTPSPTRSASSPRSWPPTARPRWPRSAAAASRSWTPACRSSPRSPASPAA